MNDQADTLRQLMNQRRQSKVGDEAVAATGGSHVITVASGKGGVGKSSLSANLGALLARQGLRVLLIDGDFGLANLDLLFNVRTEVTMEDVLEGTASIRDAVIGLEPNLWLLPAASGLREARQWGSDSKIRLARLLESCPWGMDVILVDLGAGIHHQVLSLHHPQYHSVVVLTPEPTSLADAYALIKRLRADAEIERAHVVVNQVTDGREGQRVFQKLKDVAGRFLPGFGLEYLGHCERDEKFTQAVMKRKILLDWDPGAASIPCLELLAKRMRSSLLGWSGSEEIPKPMLRARSPGVGMVSRRFKDEPALIAPGNSTGFWRALLGEVKL